MPVRRLGALVAGLPTDAASQRLDTGWSSQDEHLAQLLEATGQWGRTLALVISGQKRVRLPGQLEITRPTPPEPEQRIEKDPRQIAAFFANHFKK